MVAGVGGMLVPLLLLDLLPYHLALQVLYLLGCVVESEQLAVLSSLLLQSPDRLGCCFLAADQLTFRQDSSRLLALVTM